MDFIWDVIRCKFVYVPEIVRTIHESVLFIAVYVQLGATVRAL